MKKILLFLTLYINSLHAAEDVSLMSYRAQMLFEAGSFAEAYDLYSQIDPLVPWQKPTLQYNLATSLLARGEGEQAMYLFQKVPQTETQTSPIVLPRLDFNMALAAYTWAGTTLDLGFSLLEFAHRKLPEAQKARCNLDKLKGEKCTVFPEIEQFMHAIVMRRSDIIRAHLLHTQQTIATEEIVPWLYDKAITLKGQFDRLLHDAPQNKKLQESYLKYQQQTLHDDEVLWTRLKGLQGFDKAFLDYHLAIAASLSEYDAAIDRMVNSLKMMQTNSKPMQDITLAYRRLLSQDPINSDEISKLSPLLSEVKTDKMTTAIKLQKLAEQEAQKQHFTVARLLIEDSLYWIQRAFSPKNFVSAADVLSDTLEQQHHLTKLTTMIWLEGAMTYSVVGEMQANILAQQDLFFKAVLQQQSKQSGICQTRPWDRVIPLYDEGYQAATQAATLLLKSNEGNQELALAQQNLAAERWESALKLLREEPPSASPSAAPASSSQNSLRRLEQMENEDQSRKSIIKNRSEPRPW